MKMAKKVVEKEHVEFGEDFVALTVLCYLKENMEKYLITPAKQSQNLHTTIVIMSCQLIMLTCMQYSMIKSADEFR